ncbi:MAG: ABC transporter ATP-binding protein [Gammaproteobacteria bacterium]
MSDPVIIFNDVSKSYPLYHHFTGGIKSLIFNLPKAIKTMKTTRFEALKNLSFEVKKGETLGIIGRNGAGKSTTLGLIAGVLKPTSGKVTVRGRVSPLLELGGGFHPELNGRENIMLNGVLLGMTRKEVRQKLDKIIAFSGLGKFIDQPVRTYSSGMLAKLGFSVVAQLDPEIILIDEVLAVGDVKFQKKCIDKMMEFKRRGVTMVFVSHSMEDVNLICDRVLWIENHKIQSVGKPSELTQDYLAIETS